MGNPWGETPKGQGMTRHPITWTHRVQLLHNQFPPRGLDYGVKIFVTPWRKWIEIEKGWWWKCRHFLRILLVIHYILILTIHFLFRSSFFSAAFLSSSSSDMKKIFDSFIFFLYSYSYLYYFFYFSAVFTFSLYRLCSSFPHLLISHSLRIHKLVFYLVRLHFFSYFFTSKETRKYKGY